MARRLALYALLLAAVAAFAFLQVRGRAAPAPAQPVAARPPAKRIAPPDHFEDPGRLDPDARFLRAVGDVRHILAGGAPATATARFEDGRWHVRLESSEVGTLPEFPRFADLRSVLVGWATTLGARDSLRPGAEPATRQALAAIAAESDALHALGAASLADRAWALGLRDRRLAAAGARALTWLTAELTDRVSTGDAIGARALAWNAIATAADTANPALARETVLLAASLGYSAEAHAAAAALPALDPIRLFAHHEDGTLDAFAAGHREAREARWLALRRWVERHDLEHWEEAAARGFEGDAAMALPVLSSGLAIGRFETDMSSGISVLIAVTADLRLHELLPAPTAATADRPLGELAQTFERLLSSMPVAADGAFLDREVLAAWYRTAFYGSLLAVGEHLRDRLSSIPALEEFVADLGDGETTSGPAGEFQRWFAHLCDVKVGRVVRKDLESDLRGMPHFGAEAALRTYQVIEENTRFADPFVPWAARTLQSRLDSRPDHLWRWSGVVSGGLLDLARSERLYAQAVAASHPRDTFRRGWWASYRGDRHALDSLLAVPTDDPMEEVELLHQAQAAFPGDSVRLDARWERLVADNADDWHVILPYVRALDTRHSNGRIRRIAGAWLERPDRSLRAFDEVSARTYFGRACLREGRYQEGLDAIHAVVPSMQGDCVATAIELMDRLGRGAEAETLATVLWQRYPDNEPSQALLVDVLWRHGRAETAAEILGKARRHLSPEGWRSVLGPRFARLEREQPREARRAVAALATENLDDWMHLGGLIAALGDCGRHEAALELTPLIHGDRGAGQQLDAKLAIDSYANARAARGPEAAGEWLTGRLPGTDAVGIAYLAVYSYLQRSSDVLWQLPVTGGDEDVEFLWLLRACASVRDSVGDAVQLGELHNHFMTEGGLRSHRLGRVVLGFDPPDSTLAMGGDARQQSETAYYVGVRAQGNGDYRTAAEWYVRCMDGGFWNNGEHRWSHEQLTRWRNRGASLARLAEQDGWGARLRVVPPPANAKAPGEHTASAPEPASPGRSRAVLASTTR